MGIILKFGTLLIVSILTLLAAGFTSLQTTQTTETEATEAEPVHEPTPDTTTAETVAATSTASTSPHASNTNAATSTVLVTAPAPTLSPEDLRADALQRNLRDATVSILCTMKSDRSVTLTGGSGIIVDPRGVILTNAHVAQYFLLRDYPSRDATRCEVRTGNPAGSLGIYDAELLYLPPTWIVQNAAQIAQEEATGTGEYDFALIRITAAEGQEPPAFPAVSTDSQAPAKGEVMILSSYPVGESSRKQIVGNLYVGSSYGAVAERYAFDREHTWIDAFSVQGAFLSEQGSSGGGAARIGSGGLAGIIVTESVASTSIERSIRIITVVHIEQSLRAFGEGGIAQLLSGDPEGKAAEFNRRTAPGLTEKLLNVLINSL